MRGYYFLVCSFPLLSLGNKPEISYQEIKDLLDLNIEEKDWQKISDFQRFVDLRNLKVFWQKKPIDLRGNLNEKEIEEALASRSFFPEYVFSFLEKNPSIEYRMKHFPYLLSRFLQEEVSYQKGFLQDFFLFEREYRWVLTALRSKKLKKNLSEELRYEDPSDFFVASLLSQKEGERLDLPNKYLEIQEIFLQNFSQPKELHFALLNYRFREVEKMKESSLFTVDGVLGYMALLTLVEDWTELDEIQGKKSIDLLLAG